MSRKRQTSPPMARAIVKSLVGERDWETPGGIPAYSYFAAMDLGSALAEYDQIHDLPEGDRMRDLMERLGEDGRAAGVSDYKMGERVVVRHPLTGDETPGEVRGFKSPNQRADGKVGYRVYLDGLGWTLATEDRMRREPRQESLPLEAS